MSTRRLRVAMLASFLLGVALMLAFNVTVTRILGVASIFAFIVLGVFTIATPAYLSEDGEDGRG